MKYTHFFFPALLLLVSCERFLIIDPPNEQMASSAVYTDSASATLSFYGLLSNLTSGQNGLIGAQSRLAGLYAGELTYTSVINSLIQFSNGALQTDNSDVNTHWVFHYRYLYQLNAIVEGVTAATGISESAKTKLMAECRFWRGLLLFYMTNTWGDIPLVTGTDYRVNQALARAPQSEIYGQIIADLTYAGETLPSAHFTAGRNRPSPVAATALLARVNLYRGAWPEAAALATSVITHGEGLQLAPLDEVFLTTSAETIWKPDIFPQDPTMETWEGGFFIPSSLTNASLPVYTLSNDLYASFAAGDQRQHTWIGAKGSAPYRFAYKYRVRRTPPGQDPTESTVMLRLAEQYLIRAEASIHLGNFAQAKADLNTLRHRAGLDDLTVSDDRQALLAALEAERRHELFCEYGHYWFDLNRWEKGPSPRYWPIPTQQLLANRLLTQNEGY